VELDGIYTVGWGAGVTVSVQGNKEQKKAVPFTQNPKRIAEK